MASLYLQRSAYRNQVSPRRRATALALALGFVALLILLLLRLGALQPPPSLEGRSLKTFDVAPEGERTAAKAQRATRQAAAKAASPAAAKPPPPATSPLPPSPAPNPAAPPMMAMALGDSDIGKMAKATDGDEGDGKDSAAPYGPGEGPGGARLYNAEWYREPPPGVLALYLPGGAPPGAWATVACRTIADYHVDNCRQIDDSPPGLGLSRAVREAAWQFLVRPPRLGGKPLVGAWVRIRFYFTKGGDASTKRSD